MKSEYSHILKIPCNEYLQLFKKNVQTSEVLKGNAIFASMKIEFHELSVK